jgi:hypothetical protein
MDSTAPPRDGSPAAWPDGTRCPLCLADDVSAAVFHFEIERAPATAPSSAHGAGGARWVTVRCKCCDACRARVVRLARLRWSVLPFVVAGTVAWPLAMVTDVPQRILGLGKLEAVMITTLLCALIAGVPLVFVDVANRALRKHLEASWLFRRIRARVQPASDDDGESARTNDHWKVLADASAGAAVVEATDLLRS